MWLFVKEKPRRDDLRYSQYQEKYSMLSFDPARESVQNIYKLMIGAIVPRPMSSESGPGRKITYGTPLA